jgi:predicted TIM-barrel fold metal-dependent hydrolase
VVQVYLPVVSEAPYGHRRYWPIFEAAARHDLVVSLQFGGSPGNPPTGAGWPSHYLEEYVAMAQVF